MSRASGPVDRYDHVGAPTAPLAVAPEGATARVQSAETGDGRTLVTLHVSDFQDRLPVVPQKATDPAFADPRDEVWPDVATNRAGEGRARAVVDRQFRPAPAGRSVIIHEKPTSPENGTAGKRVACLDVGV